MGMGGGGVGWEGLIVVEGGGAFFAMDERGDLLLCAYGGVVGFGVYGKGFVAMKVGVVGWALVRWICCYGGGVGVYGVGLGGREGLGEGLEGGVGGKGVGGGGNGRGFWGLWRGVGGGREGGGGGNGREEGGKRERDRGKGGG